MAGQLGDMRLPEEADARSGATSSADATQAISFSVDGEPCAAYPGDTIAAALYACGIRAWRRARSGEARGLLCGMGVCLDCLVTVDGVPNQRACQVEVRAGMAVMTDAPATTTGTQDRLNNTGSGV